MAVFKCVCYITARCKAKRFLKLKMSASKMCFFGFPGYSVTTLSDVSTEYFVAGAPRSNHSGQVIVYTVNAQKQSAIIDSERGKQVLTFEDVVFTISPNTNIYTCRKYL